MGDLKRILIVEDSDIFADMIISFFNSWNLKIERAENGFEGIKKVYSFLPHVIITDIEMPLLKGYQMTRLLKSRKNTKNIPIIILSTLDETKDKFWSKQAGADLFIEKSPDNLNPLGEAVLQLLSIENNINFESIEKESRKINDNSIIEIVNNLLDNKLFQTTITGLLSELSSQVHSLPLVTEGVLNLLKTVCEAELSSVIIKGNNDIYIFTLNSGGFTKEITKNFLNINISDFKKLFPDSNFLNAHIADFLPNMQNDKKLLSYINIPIATAGENFASFYIANTLNDYFSPLIMENITVFFNTASCLIANALTMHELVELQNNTRCAFARYVPVDVMDEIINESAKKVRVSENRNISILFTDIRDFTSITEHTDAHTVVEFLNAYFSRMGSEIFIEGGHIDKFIGDAIMAVFGAFGNTENSAENAISAAIRILAALEQMNNTEPKIIKKKIEIGIGIHYGECILGNIGFKNKMDYTVIGDTVNLASRIESLSKIYNHPLIISESVYELCKDNFLCRKIDNVRVKGKQLPVGIYAVYSGFKDVRSEKLYGYCIDLPFVQDLLINEEVYSNYNKGLNTFYMKEWKLAKEYFENALYADYKDFLSTLYLQRCKDYLINPPPETWDGVVTLEEK